MPLKESLNPLVSKLENSHSTALVCERLNYYVLIKPPDLRAESTDGNMSVIGSWDNMFPESCVSKVTVERSGCVDPGEEGGKGSIVIVFRRLKDSHRKGSGVVLSCSRRRN